MGLGRARAGPTNEQGRYKVTDDNASDCTIPYLDLSFEIEKIEIQVGQSDA